LFAFISQARLHEENTVPKTIGTLNEKPLHAALKQWYTQPGDLVEVPVDGFTVDIVRGDLLIEIQTRNLWCIRRKLTKLLEQHPVRLVYPVAKDRWIVRQSKSGRRVLGRRKSPKRGTVELIFEEFVSIAELLAHPEFSLQVVIIQEEQVRRFDKTRNWQRKGWGTYERRLLKVVDERLFETPQDMLALIPITLSDPFTTKDLAEATDHPVWLAQKMAYCLRKMGAITVAGKRGRGILYIRETVRCVKGLQKSTGPVELPLPG
jgi:hypothetical protein